MKYPLLLSTLLATLLIFNHSAQASCYGDYTPPVAVCDHHTVVALGADGVATVYASNFDDGSYDNCGIDHFKAARMSPGWCPYGVVDDTQFRPYVQFCCEDIGYPIWIIVRVFDKNGNHNDCMVEVTVQDGSSDINCPHDKTIYCDYYFDWNDLYDPWNSYFGWPSSYGGCSAPNVTVQVHDHRNACGIGHIKRVFSTGDGYGGYGGYGYGNTCTQFIWVVSHHSFSGNIWWPKDYTASGCQMHDIHPGSLPHQYGYPTWTDSPCSMIGYNYEDKVFEFVDGVCKKILRKWTIIDWCKFDPHNPYYGGIWTHTQIIKLIDHSKPQFESCHDITINGQEEHCKGRFQHHANVWDECTPLDKLKFDYKIDLYANGSHDIIKHGHKYIDEILPIGTHKVLWFVDDNCGNVNSCSFKVTVKDKKPPTPVCYYQLSTVVMPQGGMVTIWAKDFDASSFDNCTPRHKLKFSFSSNVHEASRTFTCDDVGQVPLKIYTTDESGNQAYCNAYITLTDNGPICPEMNPVTGTVEMFTAEAVSGAQVTLYKVVGSDMVMDMQKESAADGSYKVGFGTTIYDRMLEVTKESETLAGISAGDLLRLQDHILGREYIQHPAALRAADVDRSGRAGVNDLLMLRDAILSQGRSLNGVELPWEFYPADCEWLASGQPNCESMEEISLNNLPPQVPIDFIGLKFGDINGDIMDDLDQRNVYHYPIGVRYIAEEQAYAFIALEDVEIAGMQLSVIIEAGHRVNGGFYSGDMNLSSQNSYYAAEMGMANIVWTTPTSRTLYAKEVLFYLPAEHQKGESGFSKGVFKNEVYLADRTPVPVEIKMLDVEPATPGSEFAEAGQEAGKSLTFRSSVNPDFASEKPFFAPNPMVDAGLLYFSSPVNQEVTFEVYTADRKVVVSEEIYASRGLNEITVSGSDLGMPGIYLYRLTIGTETYTGRIARVD